MKQVVAFESRKEFEEHQSMITDFNEKLLEYQRMLEEDFALKELPKAIIWTSEELATNVFSQNPIPAFTNKDNIYISPELQNWRRLFLAQLEDKTNPKIEKFYDNMSPKQILTIAGHELTHHSDLFFDEFDDEREDSIWFEEGMCDYLSRKFLLNEEEFKEITNVEAEIVNNGLKFPDFNEIKFPDITVG
ncbi:hypothetical protein [Salimicrobium jeotgali]|uniref:hypothetical protein n=1 Tax=Salimicrobium jeotgali TaxID=1230341 RepID=UPI000C848CB3|nr:hypothetical protein [Salimicrobium jeotgali]